MAKENYDEVIDQKLSELYDVLKALNTLKEKTAAVQDVVGALAEAGRGRVTEIEAAVGRLGEGIERSLADVGRSMDAVAERVNAAIENAGKNRADSIRITAETFAKSLQDLVKAANDGTARMTKAVAELRGIPLVEEFRMMRQEGEKRAADMKAVVDAAGEKVKAVIPELGKLSAKLDVESQKLSKVVSVVQEKLVSGFRSLSGELESSRTSAAEDFAKHEKRIKDSTSRVLDRMNDLTVSIKEARESLGKEFEFGTQRALSALTDVKEVVLSGIAELKAAHNDNAKKISESVKASTSKVAEEVVRARRRIMTIGVVIFVAVVLVGVIVAPVGIEAWKSLIK